MDSHMILVGPVAGVGTRLQPLTFSKPKAFIKVAGKRVIDHVLDRLSSAFSRGTRLVFVVGYKRHQFIAHVSQAHDQFFDVRFVRQPPVAWIGDVPLFGGLGEAVLLSRDEVFGPESPEGDDLLVFLADMVPREDYARVVVRFLKGVREDELDGVITVVRVPREEAKHYGVVVTDERGRVTALREKPTRFVSDLAIAGIYAFSRQTAKHLFEVLDRQRAEHVRSSARGTAGELQFTPALEQLVEDGRRLLSVQLERGVLDFGRPDTLLAGNRALLEEVPLAGHAQQLGTNATTTRVVHPVHVGANSRLINCNLGPHVSIGDGCVLENCVVENSVIGDGVRLKNVITSGAIVGDYADLSGLCREGMVVGDGARAA
ncbi:MAG: sugar phosphate nucleotidyltransferase [Promethearchaeota archaeon]